MDTDLAGWTTEEQELARSAFASAQRREIQALIESLRAQAALLASAEDIWTLHDALSLQRHAIEGRFEFRLEGLLFVFAGFVRDGLLSHEELLGLSADKQAKIKAMARF